MLIFLYGLDAYRLKQARQNIVEEYKKKHSSGVNIFRLDLSDDGNLEKLSDTVRSMSFFNEHKLVIISGSFVKKTVADDVAGIVKSEGLDLAKDITLLFAEPNSETELAKNKDLFRILTGSGSMVKVFNPLEGAKLAQWVQKEFEVRGCSVHRDALNKLLNTVGNDSRALINEIEKLVSYKGGGEVSASDVNLLVDQSRELNVFDLVDAFASRNNKRAIELLYLNLAFGHDPYYLMSLIVGQFRNLLSVKDLNERGFAQAEIIKKTGLHPFVVRKTLGQARNYGVGKLKNNHSRLIGMDIGSKRGGSKMEDYLYSLALLN